MTLSQAIDKLISLRHTYGDISVYFDCPKCDNSFTPNKVVTMAVHLTEEKK